MLDYFSLDDKNFHQIVFDKKISPEKIIAISSVSSYNEKTKSEGVTKIIQKNYNNLPEFKSKLKKEIEKFIKIKNISF